MSLPIINSGDSQPVAYTKINAAIAELNAATFDRNMGSGTVKRSVTNANIIDATQVYINGVAASSGYLRPITATRVSPLVFTFTAPQLAAPPFLRAGGIDCDPSDYTITGGPASVALSNGTFEAGLAGWTPYVPEAISTVSPDTGTQCAAVAQPLGYLNQSVAGFTSGTVYPITVRVRGDVGTSAVATLQITNSAATSVLGTATVSLTSSWATLSATFTAPSDGTINISLIKTATGTGTAYFDNVVIFGPVAATNPGFESGLAGWTLFPDVTVYTSGTHSGANCIQVVGDGAYLYQGVTGFAANLNITATVYVRCDAGGTATVQLQCTDNASGNLVTSPATALTTAWQAVSMPYQVNSTGAVTLALIRNPGSGPVYFDDAVLTGRNTATGTYTITFSSAAVAPFASETVSVMGVF